MRRPRQQPRNEAGWRVARGGGGIHNFGAVLLRCSTRRCTALPYVKRAALGAADGLGAARMLPAVPHAAVAPAVAPRPLLNARAGAVGCAPSVRLRTAPGASAGRSAYDAASAAPGCVSAVTAPSLRALTPARRLAGAAAAGARTRAARCVCQANRRAEFRRWHVDDAKVYDAPGDEYTLLGDIWGVRQGRKYAVDVTRGAGKLVRVQLEHENGRRVAPAAARPRPR